MSEILYSLDTNIILALVRGSDLGRYVDETYGLRRAKQRPVTSVVTHGEVRVLAHRNNWGAARLDALSKALDNLVTIDINHPAVLQAYVDIDLASDRHPDGARNMGKNDLWIAACTRAAGATLLTTDRDFEHLIPDHINGEIIDPGSHL